MSEADEENETIEGAMAVYMAIATQVLPVHWSVRYRYCQGGSEHWAIYYTSPQSLSITFPYLLA